MKTNYFKKKVEKEFIQKKKLIGPKFCLSFRFHPDAILKRERYMRKKKNKKKEKLCMKF